MNKIRLWVLFCLLILRGGVLAQNIYESIGKEAKILTLSNGKYQEIITNDTIVRIGTVLFNTVQKEVVAFLDSADTEGVIEADVASRFLSVDPIGREYPELSPYQFASNTPIIAIDIDGLEAEWMTQTIWNSREKVRRQHGNAAAQEYDKAVKYGMIATGAALTDIFLTKGWLSRTLGGAELLNAVSNDHAASNIKGDSYDKERLKKEAREGYESAAKGYVIGKTIGVAGPILVKTAKEIKVFALGLRRGNMGQPNGLSQFADSQKAFFDESIYDVVPRNILENQGFEGGIKYIFSEAKAGNIKLKFDLDGFDIKTALTDKGKSFYEAKGYTNYEFNEILSDKKLIDATKFYENGKQISTKEVLDRVKQASGN
jgi:hypothetical protein